MYACWAYTHGGQPTKSREGQVLSALSALDALAQARAGREKTQCQTCRALALLKAPDADAIRSAIRGEDFSDADVSGALELLLEEHKKSAPSANAVRKHRASKHE